jgi:hypothetical protein
MLFLVAASFGETQSRLIHETRDANSVFQIRTWPGSVWELPGVESAAEAFLDQEAVGHRTAVLSIYPDAEHAAREALACEDDRYKQWRAAYDAFPRHGFQAADVIDISGNALLRLVSADGTVVRRVLKGEDPTRVSINGIPFEILFLTGRVHTRFEGCGVPGATDPVLYLKTDSVLTQEICEQATQILAEKLATKHIWVSVRHDIWFLCSRFPVVFPFAPSMNPPDEKTLRNSPEYTCSLRCDGKPNCLLTSGTTSRPTAATLP